MHVRPPSSTIISGVRKTKCEQTGIIKYLKDYHYVLMLDADAFINEPSISIEEKIAEFMTDDFTIVVPKNCMVGESR